MGNLEPVTEHEGTTHADLSAQIESVKIDLDRAFRVGLFLAGVAASVAIAAITGTIALYVSQARHEEALDSLKSAHVAERVTSLEATRFTTSDASRLASDVGVRFDALKSELATIREALVAIRTQKEQRP